MLQSRNSDIKRALPEDGQLSEAGPELGKLCQRKCPFQKSPALFMPIHAATVAKCAECTLVTPSL